MRLRKLLDVSIYAGDEGEPPLPPKPSKRKTRFRGITKNTTQVLRREDIDAEFKRGPGAIKADALVAFANGEGGWILGGVEDDGTVVGCQVGDQAIRSVQTKADSCRPPVQVAISVENTGDKPILVVHVPSSDHKPHCTGGGTYVVRRHNATGPLEQSALLAMLLAREADTFAERFRGATSDLRKQVESVGQLSQALTGLFVSMSEDLETSVANVAKLVDGLDSSVSSVEGSLDELDVEVSRLVGPLEAALRDHRTASPQMSLTKDVRIANMRLLALLQATGVDDPVEAIEEKEIRQMVGMFWRTLKDRSGGLTLDEFEAFLVDALQEGYPHLPELRSRIIAEEIASRKGTRKG